jgi:hypothetical protein
MAPTHISIWLAFVAALAVGLAGAQPGRAGVCCLGDACLDAGNGILSEAQCVAGGGTWSASPASCATSGICLCGEINDCNGNCALPGLVGNGGCDDGTLDWHGNAVHFDCAAFDCDDGDCSAASHPDCTGSPSEGACCLPDDSCVVTADADECAGLLGEFHGAGADCELFMCGQLGACCFEDGHCEQATWADCEAPDSVSWTPLHPCDPNPCAQLTEGGACCLPDDSCTMTADADECAGLFGEYQGDGIDCDAAACGGVGACCFCDGHCEQLTMDDCFMGEDAYAWGPGQPCDPSPCAEWNDTGACCFEDGTCADLTWCDCTAALGSLQWDATCDEPDVCQAYGTGACCLGEDQCEVLSSATCEFLEGAYLGNGTPCVVPCVPPGACCFADGSCQMKTEAQCAAAAGTYDGDPACDPNPCPQPPSGACCLGNGSCQVRTPAQCVASSGDYQGDDVSCATADCPQPPTGACCLDDGTCQTKTEAQCAAAGGDYQGNDVLCSATDCPQPSCTYELTTAALGEGRVTANPSRDTYGCDAAVHLTATADDCWHFVRWHGDLTGTANPAAITMDGNKSITAMFEMDPHTLKVVVEGEGHVSLDPAGATYACGGTVRLAATADPGWHFVRWEGDASGTNAGSSVVMSQDRSVTAVFEQDTPDQSGGSSDGTGDTNTDDTGADGTGISDTDTDDTGTSDTGNGGDQSGTGTRQPSQSGAICPAASAGMIGLTLVGLLRTRRSTKTALADRR